jgi:hypothetical protein
MPSRTSTTRPVTREITGGVDTHRDTHHAAVIDELGRELGDAEFPATPAGYRRLLAWMRTFGPLTRVGLEGTSAYGAALARYLRRSSVVLVEVNRPDRSARHSKGKSDSLDAMPPPKRRSPVPGASTPRAMTDWSRPSAPYGSSVAARSKHAPVRVRPHVSFSVRPDV